MQIGTFQNSREIRVIYFCIDVAIYSPKIIYPRAISIKFPNAFAQRCIDATFLLFCSILFYYFSSLQSWKVIFVTFYF